MSRLFYQIISPDRKFYHVPVYLLLRAISFVYGGLHGSRLWAYRSGFFKTRRLDRRVISVGNLTLGGTGKTPVVMMIAEALRDNGCKPVILSRGYGGKLGKGVYVVSDGREVLLSPESAGDEPVMMARRLKNIPVLIGPDRYRSGSVAIECFGADTLVLDDGFQHVQLARDLNVVLFDAQKPLGNGNLFPAGELRESAAQASRADLVIITRCGAGETGQIPAPENVPVVKTAYRLASLVRMDTGEVLEPDALRDEPVAALCGIAQPEDFLETLRRAGTRVVHFKGFPDHHVYSAGDLQAFEAQARQAGAKTIVASEKDTVKIDPAVLSLPLMALRMQVEILEGRELFDRYVLGNRQGKMAESKM